jgi:hypothetical protein
MLLLVVTLAPFVSAQADVDLAVGFPATTLAYASASEEWVEYASEFGDAFKGFESEFKIPSLGQILRERFDLEMTDEEGEALLTGTKRGAIGLLDYGISGPKVQLVLEHKDLSALVRALDKGHKDNPDLIEEVDDYYGTNVYKLYLPFMQTGSNRDFNPVTMILNSLAGQLLSQDFYLAAFENKYLVFSTSKSAVKDAIDFLSYPEDAEDTLLGNKRYKEAVVEFKDADALLFINVSSVITTIERIGGDKGSNPILRDLSRGMAGSDGMGEFIFNLVQYEQFKSFAAAVDYNPKDNTFVAKASLEFHNAPGWFEALRVEPSEWTLTDYLPDNALFALGSTTGDYDKLYKRFREYFLGRARNAGMDALIEGWEAGEAEVTGDADKLETLLKQFGKGASIVAIPPTEEARGWSSAAPKLAVLFALKNFEEAESYFYDELLDTSIGREMQEDGVESDAGIITIFEGVEIHHNQREIGFALVPDSEAGLFVSGELACIKAVIAAKTQKASLEQMDSYKQAQELTWTKVSTNLYLNMGGVIDLVAGFGRTFSRFGRNRNAGNVGFRDDTLKDNDFVPFIADVFRKTALVSATRSTETGMKLRFSAAGLPTQERVKDMLSHFKMVSYNTQVRNDLLELRRGLIDEYCTTEKIGSVNGLVESGRVKKDDVVDAYDEEGKREYAVAEQADEPDIRQAILLAHQKEPGLRGKYLAVLWNGHIVALTEEQLHDSIERARKGQRLDDENWYKEALKPLTETYEEYEDWEQPSIGLGGRKIPKAKVVIIDEEGDEEEVEVDEEKAAEETEEILDALDKAEKKEEE